MEKKLVLISGLPGNMASEVAEAIQLSDDISLCTEAFGLDDANFELLFPQIHNREREIIVDVLGMEKHEEYLKKNTNNRFMIVDFTFPNAALGNAEIYCRYGYPFGMGTTMKAEDRSRIEEIVRNSETSALIAPNMAKQVVALQWAMEEFAAKNPGLLKGYKLRIIESHQQGKKDTSGTAKAMVKYFNQLGIEFDISQIEMIRDAEKQIEMGVPKQYIEGHGWHTYILTPQNKQKKAITLADPESYFPPTGLSAFDGLKRECGEIERDGRTYNAITFESSDSTMFFMFGFDEKDGVVITHNINGRKPYALGALDAVRFLHNKINEGSKGKVYSMIDVIKGR